MQTFRKMTMLHNYVVQIGAISMRIQAADRLEAKYLAELIRRRAFAISRHVSLPITIVGVI
jgi:hypothetical protein